MEIILEFMLIKKKCILPNHTRYFKNNSANINLIKLKVRYQLLNTAGIVHKTYLIA